MLLKGHWHEKRVSNKHMGDVLSLQYKPLPYLNPPPPTIDNGGEPQINGKDL
jgi:hypothetical protein